MKRILVIGCPGASKSTFSRKLSAATALPIYYLDMIWHKADRTTVSAEEFDNRLEEILQSEQWIIDGNYLRTMQQRLQYCDTVFYLDIPQRQCLAGIEERLGKPREDMPWIDIEIDAEFRQWILDFPAIQAPQIASLLGAFRGEVFHFKSRQEADDYIESLKRNDRRINKQTTTRHSKAK